MSLLNELRCILYTIDEFIMRYDESNEETRAIYDKNIYIYLANKNKTYDISVIEKERQFVIDKLHYIHLINKHENELMILKKNAKYHEQILNAIAITVILISIRYLLSYF